MTLLKIKSEGFCLSSLTKAVFAYNVASGKIPRAGSPPDTKVFLSKKRGQLFSFLPVIYGYIYAFNVK
jgi:hypothetical protein